MSRPGAAGTLLTWARGLILLGAAACAVSIYATFRLALDPTFAATGFDTPRHTNYHAFRGGCLALGAVAAIVYIVLLPSAARTRPLWNVALLIALFYFGGWWLPWPLLGLRAPGVVAEAVHLAATALSLIGLLLARRAFPAAIVTGTPGMETSP